MEDAKKKEFYSTYLASKYEKSQKRAREIEARSETKSKKQKTTSDVYTKLGSIYSIQGMSDRHKHTLANNLLKSSGMKVDLGEFEIKKTDKTTSETKKSTETSGGETKNINSKITKADMMKQITALTQNYQTLQQSLSKTKSSPKKTNTTQPQVPSKDTTTSPSNTQTLPVGQTQTSTETTKDFNLNDFF